MSSGGGSGPIPPDLLSAFFDGEVSEQERRLAERVLGESEQAAEEFEDYRKLRVLLREAQPKESLGPEFPSSVLRQIEREMLLPSTVEVRRTGRVRRWARLLAVAAGLVVAAVLTGIWLERAKLLVRGTDELAQSKLAGGGYSVAMERAGEAGLLEQRGPQRGGVGLESVSPTARANSTAGSGAALSAATESPPVAAMLERKASGRPAGDFEEDRASQRSVAEDELAAASRATATPSPSKAKQTLAGRSQPEPSSDRTEAKNSGWRLAFNNSSLQAADVGQVVEALATSGDRVSIVRLTVLDKQQGLNSLQLLLARNSVTPIAGQSATGPSEEGESLVAVYVELTSDQLAATLRQLQHDDLFRGLDVAGPIDVAQLDVPELNEPATRSVSSKKGGRAPAEKPLAESSHVAGVGSLDRASSSMLAERTTRSTPEAPQKVASNETSESKGEPGALSKSRQGKAASVAEAVSSSEAGSAESALEGKNARGATPASRQVAFVLPPLIVERLQQIRASGNNPATPDGKRTPRTTPAATSGLPGTVHRERGRLAGSKSRLVRVLFVLVPMEQQG